MSLAECDKVLFTAMITRCLCLLALVAGSLTLAACRKQPAATAIPTPIATTGPATPVVAELPAVTPPSPLAIDTPPLTIDNSAGPTTPEPTSTLVPGDPFDLNRYRFRVVQAADDALSAGDYDTALALYKQVIEDETLLAWNPALLVIDQAGWPANGRPPDLSDPNERERLTAYAYYRLMVLYAARADARRVLLTYEVLQGTFTPGSAGYSYAELGSEFWWRYQVNQDVALSCSRARRYTSAHPDEILAPLGPGFYGRFGRDYSRDDICPFW